MDFKRMGEKFVVGPENKISSDEIKRAIRKYGQVAIQIKRPDGTIEYGWRVTGFDEASGEVAAHREIGGESGDEKRFSLADVKMDGKQVKKKIDDKTKHMSDSKMETAESEADIIDSFAGDLNSSLEERGKPKAGSGVDNETSSAKTRTPRYTVAKPGKVIDGDEIMRTTFEDYKLVAEKSKEKISIFKNDLLSQLSSPEITTALSERIDSFSLFLNESLKLVLTGEVIDARPGNADDPRRDACKKDIYKHKDAALERISNIVKREKDRKTGKQLLVKILNILDGCQEKISKRVAELIVVEGGGSKAGNGSREVSIEERLANGEKIDDVIRSVQNFEELYEAIKCNGDDKENFIVASAIIELIEDVRSGKASADRLTDHIGIRSAVKRILDNEPISKNQDVAIEKEPASIDNTSDKKSGLTEAEMRWAEKNMAKMDERGKSVKMARGTKKKLDDLARERDDKKMTKGDLAKMVGTAAIGTAASVVGVRGFHDVPMYLYQKWKASGKKQSLQEFMEDVASKEKPGMSESLNDIVEIIEGMDISERDKDFMMEKVNELIENFNRDKTKERGMTEEDEERLKEVLSDYVKTKISGIQAVRESVNTALVMSGAFALRFGVFKMIETVGRAQRLKQEEKDKLRQAKEHNRLSTADKQIDIAKLAEGDQKNKAEFIVKDVFVGSIKETWDGLFLKDKAGKKGALAKGAAFVKSASSILGIVGMGAMAAHNPEAIDNAIHKLSTADNFNPEAIGDNFVQNLDRTFGRAFRFVQDKIFGYSSEGISSTATAGGSESNEQFGHKLDVVPPGMERPSAAASVMGEAAPIAHIDGPTQADMATSSSVEIGGNVRTITKALDVAVHKADVTTQDNFIKNVFRSSHTELNLIGDEISLDNREALLRRAINIVSTANLKMGDGFDVDNLVYEGNKVELHADGTWVVEKGVGLREAGQFQDAPIEKVVAGKQAQAAIETTNTKPEAGISFADKNWEKGDKYSYVSEYFDREKLVRVGYIDTDGDKNPESIVFFRRGENAFSVFKRESGETLEQFVARANSGATEHIEACHAQITRDVPGIKMEYLHKSGFNIYDTGDPYYKEKLSFIYQQGQQSREGEELSLPRIRRVLSLSDEYRVPPSYADEVLHKYGREEYQRASAALKIGNLKAGGVNVVSLKATDHDMVEAIKSAPDDFIGQNDKILTGYVQTFGEKGAARIDGIRNMFGLDVNQKMQIGGNDHTITIALPENPGFKIIVDSRDNTIGVDGPALFDWGIKNRFFGQSKATEELNAGNLRKALEEMRRLSAAYNKK